jgi:drug/metabolite transporter (DMT)-like permease
VEPEGIGLALTLALASALLLGVGDYLAGVTLQRDGRHSAALTYTTIGSGVGVVVIGVLLSLVPPDHIASSDVGWAIAAGACLGIALPLLMVSMARGPIAVVAPVIGLMSLAVPAVVGPLVGDHLSGFDVAGLFLALPAAALVAAPPDGPRGGGPAVMPAVVLATLVGALLGAAAICFGQTAEASGIGPAAVAQVTATVLLLIVGGASRRLVRLRRPALPPAIGVGVLSVLAAASSVVAFQRGPVAVVAAVIGLAPGVTVGLAWLVAHERIGRTQVAGFTLGAAAVILFAVG